MAKARYQALKVREIAQGGDGVAELPDGRICFVPGALPGDRVDVELTRDKKRWARARVLSIAEPSVYRVEPECSYVSKGCGGCQFWHVSPEQELAWKAKAAFEAMQRIAGVVLPEPVLHHSPQIKGYRSRVRLHQGEDGVGLGFYSAEGKRLIKVGGGCEVAMPLVRAVASDWQARLGALGAAEVLIETASCDEVVITVMLEREGLPGQTALDALRRDVDADAAVRGMRVRDEGGASVELGRVEVDAGEVLASVPESEERTYTLDAGQFRQSNPKVNALLVERVAALLSELGGRRVLELFCGAGNFSFALARQLDALYGLEGSFETVRAAKMMAAGANLGHLGFARADLFEAKSYEAVVAADFDTVLLDPPRDGAQEAARWLASAENPISNVVYIACDPGCMARDLGVLSEGGWRVEGLEFFDMFPRTRHIETLAWLRRP
ncbi:23S rRNA (uracil(1939)-C(5))-methyltransferase RlmD [Lujinxingia sediminis]|uniref:23S rRNA (Uracil(1939)-C(5))-methyltransferase RlmD n=1 Tax=Lujinxingia sediminis TaxID=2480984 RepID=A0ABY0CTG1_9DELT|nr:23S rRNA (uracil(1939)-C(5))-methyltransferase RlmD [Lujinxingia sediminis]RVU44748.1 23S rRNA (uracil(1939)-C(5))-methyltransferase RlmD [Lujinxingia sediminis]